MASQITAYFQCALSVMLLFVLHRTPGWGGYDGTVGLSLTHLKIYSQCIKSYKALGGKS